MYLETPPKLIETSVLSAMPEKFRRRGERTEWAEHHGIGDRLGAGCGYR
jgi:hypothetical protein